MNVQMKKGALELCVLLLLDRSECYGYELISRISQSIAVTEGSMYPLLKRLRDDLLVTAYLEESTQGPARKYYKITDAGKQSLCELIDEWEQLVNAVNEIRSGGAADEKR